MKIEFAHSYPRIVNFCLFVSELLFSVDLHFVLKVLELVNGCLFFGYLW